MSLSFLTDMAMEALNSVTPELWKKCCSHVQNIEEIYWTTDGIVENAVDELVIRLGGDDDSTSEDSSSDSDSVHYTDDELCQPLPVDG